MKDVKDYFLFLLGSYILLILFVWPVIFNCVYKQLMSFAPDTLLYKMWLNIPVPIYFELHTFNWSNAKEFEKDPSLKPEFVDVGPFVFEEIHEKVNVSWNDDASTVSFNQTKTWRFIPEKSADISTNITNLNCFAATVALSTNSWHFNHSFLIQRVVDGLLKRYESFITTNPAKNWLFDGIDHRLLYYINLLRNVTYIPIPYEKFGWFYRRNGSSEYEGRYEMKTGATNLYEMGTLVKWNNVNQTQYYPGECGKIKGLAGELIPPVNKFQKNITFFSPDLCSYITLNCVDSIEVGGITVNVYEGDNTFNYDEKYLENHCFCDVECPLQGVRNVSSCTFGSPAFVSFPHFFRANPKYAESINGMKPNDIMHKFILKLEPRTGVPLEMQAGLQINFLLEPFGWSDIYRDKPKIYIPLIWFRQRTKISDELLMLIKIFLFVSQYGQVVLFVFGEICFILGFLLLLKLKKNRHKKDVEKFNLRHA